MSLYKFIWLVEVQVNVKANDGKEKEGDKENITVMAFCGATNGCHVSPEECVDVKPGVVGS